MAESPTLDDILTDAEIHAVNSILVGYHRPAIHPIPRTLGRMLEVALPGLPLERAVKLLLAIDKAINRIRDAEAHKSMQNPTMPPP